MYEKREVEPLSFAPLSGSCDEQLTWKIACISESMSVLVSAVSMHFPFHTSVITRYLARMSQHSHLCSTHTPLYPSFQRMRDSYDVGLQNGYYHGIKRLIMWTSRFVEELTIWAVLHFQTCLTLCLVLIKCYVSACNIPRCMFHILSKRSPNALNMDVLQPVFVKIQ